MLPIDGFGRRRNLSNDETGRLHPFIATCIPKERDNNLDSMLRVNYLSARTIDRSCTEPRRNRVIFVARIKTNLYGKAKVSIGKILDRIILIQSV